MSSGGGGAFTSRPANIRCYIFRYHLQIFSNFRTNRSYFPWRPLANTGPHALGERGNLLYLHSVNVMESKHYPRRKIKAPLTHALPWTFLDTTWRTCLCKHKCLSQLNLTLNGLNTGRFQVKGPCNDKVYMWLKTCGIRQKVWNNGTWICKVAYCSSTWLQLKPKFRTLTIPDPALK